MGALQSTHTYSTGVLYNAKIPYVVSEVNVQKAKAVAWYKRWVTFKNISPNQTYEQALLKNSDKKCSTVKKWSTVWDDKKALSVSTTENHDRRVVSKSSCQTSMNQHKNKIVSHAYHTVH